VTKELSRKKNTFDKLKEGVQEIPKGGKETNIKTAKKRSQQNQTKTMGKRE